MEGNIMRKVMIGTPCFDGRIDVWYVNSLVETIKESKKYDIDIRPIWVSFDSLVQRARNDTIKIALDNKFDDLVWIDSDIEWKPKDFFNLLSYSEDVVGGTYRKKGDIEEYVLKQMEGKPLNKNGLMEVNALGTGFVKMSRKACQYLWDTSEFYIDTKDNSERRMIFDVRLVDKLLMSEDVWAFENLRRGGFKIWLDTNITCNHSGPYKFQGNFLDWYKNRPKNVNNKTAPAIIPQKKYRQL